MLTINSKSHLSPKDRVRQLAAEVQTVPGFSLNDSAFHAPYAFQRDVAQFSRVHNAIKGYYLSLGHSLADWSAVSGNPQAFNRVWRASLDLSVEDTPPPLAFRSRLPQPIPF